MNRGYTDLNLIRDLYHDQTRISRRGNFIKSFANRKWSIRDIILQLLPDCNGLKVLDIGCGNCSFIRRLQRTYPTADIYCLDVAFNSNCAGLPNYFIYDGKNLPDTFNEFDLIFAMHMLYHVEHPLEFLEVLRTKLRPGAHFIITTKSRCTLNTIENCFKETMLVLAEDMKDQRDEDTFNAETGLEILREIFKGPTFRIDDYLLTTQIITKDFERLLKYILSTHRYNASRLFGADDRKKKHYITLLRSQISKHRIFIDTMIEAVFHIQHGI